MASLATTPHRWDLIMRYEPRSRRPIVAGLRIAGSASAPSSHDRAGDRRRAGDALPHVDECASLTMRRAVAHRRAVASRAERDCSCCIAEERACGAAYPAMRPARSPSSPSFRLSVAGAGGCDCAERGGIESRSASGVRRTRRHCCSDRDRRARSSIVVRALAVRGAAIHKTAIVCFLRDATLW